MIVSCINAGAVVSTGLCVISCMNLALPMFCFAFRDSRRNSSSWFVRSVGCSSLAPSMAAKYGKLSFIFANDLHGISTVNRVNLL